MTDDRGHSQLEHTADLALRFWAPSEAELLVEAAQALVQVMTDGQPLERAASRQIALDAIDAEDRLVRWLNEVLVLATVDGFLMADATVTLQPAGLQATLVGQADALALVRTELKSVTYHQLELRQVGQRFVGRVVVDV